jgi:DNA-binding HxlR family transcriptional regulator
MTIQLKPNPCLKQCPSRHFIELIGDKWTLLVLHALAHGPQRNGQLMRAIEGVSQKMLTQTLRRLEANGLVARRDFNTLPPQVDYSLTELGTSFGRVLASLDDWLDQHIPDLVTMASAEPQIRSDTSR